MTQNAKTTFWEEIKRDWNCGKSTSKTQLWHCGELVLRLTIGPRPVVQVAFGREGSGMVPQMWKMPLWEIVWPSLDPWNSVRLRTASTHWNVPVKYGRMVSDSSSF